MKRIFALVSAIALVLSLTGCAFPERGEKQYSVTYLTLFDTVTTIIGTDVSESAFGEKAQKIHDELLRYHRLFDIYHSYEGLHNLKTVNDNAGIQSVDVAPEIIALLQDCKEYYALTGGKVNVAMGAVLGLWHEARNRGLNNPMQAELPDQKALEEAALHANPEDIILDPEQGTVFLADPDMRLDVGAIAKGWAVQRVAGSAPEGMLINVGGNTFATGPKDDAGSSWTIGVQNPDSDGYLHTLGITNGAVVTSGDYQRGYYVADKYYHHIIDPVTLYPAALWRSVTIVCIDSGLADALSTALFLMDLESGKRLLEACGAEAMWLDAEGNMYYTDGFSAMLRS